MAVVAHAGDNATLHPWLARAGMVGLLCLLVGHGMCRALPGLGQMAWLGLIGVGVVAMAVRSLGSREFAVGFCLFAVGVGAWQGAGVQGRDRAAAEIVERVADGGSPLGEIVGNLSAMPVRGANHWTLHLAAGSIIASRGMVETLPAPATVRLRGDPSVDERLRPLIPGDGVRALGEFLELPRSGRESEPWGWHSDRGSVLLVQAREIATEPREHSLLSAGNFARISWETGNKAEGWIFWALPRREAGLLVAMTLGRTGHLAPDQRIAFRRAGLMHLFAVSGLHTALIGGMVLLLLRTAGVPVGPRLFILALFLLFFAVLVGWKASVLRAALLLFLFDLRELLRRPVDPMGALGAVGMVLVLLWPRSPWQVDFQMTFLCMVAIIAASPWLVAWQKIAGRRLGWGWGGGLVVAGVQILLLSAVIQLALAPILAARFGEVSVIAPLANLLLMPIATLCIKATFLILLMGLALPWEATWLLEFLEHPLRLLMGGAGLLGHLPGAAFQSTPWPIPLLGLYFAILALGPWNQHHHFSQPRRPLWAFFPASLALLLVMAWIPLWNLFPTPMKIWVLDVGQGDAILIRSPDGRHALIDSGPPGSAWLLPGMLRSRGVSELDWVVATHADADHIGGMATVLREFPTHHLLVGGSLAQTQLFADLAGEVEKLGQPVATVRRGAMIPLGRHLQFQVLHPTEEFIQGDLGRNDASIVLRVEHGGVGVLLTGDAEGPAEADMVESMGAFLPSHVMLAAHHGSRGSTTSRFLDAVGPELVLVSCGRNNRYGHPAPETLQRIAEANAVVMRTDTDGTILLRITADGRLTVSATRR